MIRKTSRSSRSSTVPLAEIEARIEGYLQAAEAGETIVVTRNGNPVAALIPLEERRPEPKAGLASLAGGWEGSDELIEHIEEARRVSRRFAD
jgi:prevent-host-death family protein